MMQFSDFATSRSYSTTYEIPIKLQPRNHFSKNNNPDLKNKSQCLRLETLTKTEVGPANLNHLTEVDKFFDFITK